MSKVRVEKKKNSFPSRARKFPPFFFVFSALLGSGREYGSVYGL